MIYFLILESFYMISKYKRCVYTLKPKYIRENVKITIKNFFFITYSVFIYYAVLPTHCIYRYQEILTFILQLQVKEGKTTPSYPPKNTFEYNIFYYLNKDD